MGPIPEPSCPNRQLRKAALRSHRSDPIPTGRRRTRGARPPQSPEETECRKGRSGPATRPGAILDAPIWRHKASIKAGSKVRDAALVAAQSHAVRALSHITRSLRRNASRLPLLPWMRCYQCGPASAVKPRCRSRLAQRAKREIACVRGQIRARHSPRQMPQRVHDDVSRIVLAAQRCD